MEKPLVIRSKLIHTIRKNSFEKRYWAEQKVVCGIDEAGRGPLAGPVVAAAVIVPKGCTYRLLKDSKILSESERLKAYTWIIKHCFYGIGIEHHISIDTHNIYQASLRAMQRALCQLAWTLTAPIDAILIDAMPLTLTTPLFETTPVHAFIYGESRSISIAAASIVAKVTRDRLMSTLDRSVPGYAFAIHKGYGTPEHKLLLQNTGKSLIHRSTFVSAMEMYKDNDDWYAQGTIWGGD